MLFLFRSSCPTFATCGQLSHASPCSSPSVSTWFTLAKPWQLSLSSDTPSLSKSISSQSLPPSIHVPSGYCCSHVGCQRGARCVGSLILTQVGEAQGAQLVKTESIR